MEYKTSPDLDRQINRISRKISAVSIFRIAVIFIFTVIFYPHFKSIDVGAIVIILTLLVGINFISYSQIKSSGSVISVIAKDLIIDDKSIQAKTAGFKMFFFERKANLLNFKSGTLKIMEVDFPLNKLLNTKFRTLRVFDEEKECFVLTDFFDRELIEKLNIL